MVPRIARIARAFKVRQLDSRYPSISRSMTARDASISIPPSAASSTDDAVEADDTGIEQHKLTTSTSSRFAKNAFQTLMASPSRKNGPAKNRHNRSGRDFEQHLTRPGRGALGECVKKPEAFPAVLYYNKDFVVIKDKFPKSSVHILLLPRTKNNTLHPFSAFKNEELLKSTKNEAEKVVEMAAEELRRLFGQFSAKEKIRQNAIASAIEGELPSGRDWKQEIMVGVHAGPSMNHLHVHILSKDRISTYMKHRKHYNSFNTNFFVKLEEFPLAQTDSRWGQDRGGGLSQDLLCWRCGCNFGNKFQKLKEHLEVEFEEWKKL